MTHRLHNYSISDPRLARALNGIDYDVLYVDPPWGDGHMKMFATMMAKDTGRRPEQISFQSLLEELATLALFADHTFIEIGPRWAEQVALTLKDQLPNVNVHEGYVYGPKNLPLRVVSAGGPWKPPTLSAKKGYPMVRDIIKSVRRADRVVFDPCCGLGYTARATIELGMTFVGNEINPVRLERTRQLIERMGGNLATAGT